MGMGTTSLWVLVAANLAPLAGVAFAGWKAEQVLLLYWMENFIVGAWNLARIAVAQPQVWRAYGAARLWLTKFGHALFFTLHFGALGVAYGVLLATVVQRDPSAGFWGMEKMLERQFASEATLICLGVLAASHGWSFFANYLGRGEYKGITPRDLRNRPYRRMVPMHFMVILVGLLLVKEDEQLLPVLMFVALKIGFDAYFHLSDHRRARMDANP